MKKLIFIFTALSMSLALMILSSPMIYASSESTPNSVYTFDDYTSTVYGLTLDIAEGTNTFTMNGTVVGAAANISLPSLHDPNTNGSVLSTGNYYALVYEYVSGSASFSGSNYIRNILTPVGDSQVQSTQSISLTATNYQEVAGVLMLPQDTSNFQISLSIGSSATNLIFKIHVIPITDPFISDIDFFVSSGSGSLGGATVTLTSPRTIAINGLASAASSLTLDSYINPALLNSNTAYLFVTEHVSGTIDSVGYNLRPIKFNNDDRLIMPQSQVSSGTVRGYVGTGISTLSISNGTSSNTLTNYTYRINVFEIELYPPAVVTSHTVTFNSNGGSSVVTQTVLEGNLASVPPDPTRPGYDFVEWRIAGTLLAYNFNAPVTSDITLYALWLDNSTQVYTITFNTDGGTQVNAIEIEDGDIAVAPTAPLKSGYSFLNWVITGTETVFDFSSAITSDLSLTAVWETSEVTFILITFNSNGGSFVASQVLYDGDLPVEPTDPTRSGYTFAGWYKDIALTQAFSFVGDAVTEDLSLYAKWTPVSGGGDPITPDEGTSSSVWLYVGLGALVLAVLAGSELKKKGKRR